MLQRNVTSVTTQPWNLVFLIFFITYVAIRAIYIERAKKAKGELLLRRVDAFEIVAMGLVIVGSMLLPVLYLIHAGVVVRGLSTAPPPRTCAA